MALGDVRGKLAGLQWSYAKLSGPNSATLLAACTSLTSLKLRLWYQDYNLRPFKFNLAQLTTLTNLRSLVIDKRPPFQQQLPAQQGAISIPLTPGVLQACAASWPQLQKLQLGLSRSDFGASPLQGLAGFTQLKSLSVHCYDQGYDDGQYMLPMDITCLPSSLVKVDLMHAELFSSGTEDCRDSCSSGGSSSSSGSSSSHRRRELLAHSSCSVSSGSSGSILRTCSSNGFDPGSSGSSKHAACCNGGKHTGRVGFAAATAHAFTSMLSESFSVLSRQASLDCSAPYMDQLPAQPYQQQQQQQQQQAVQAYYTQCQQQQQQQQQQHHQQQQQQVQSLAQPCSAGVSAFASATGAAAAAAAATIGSSARLVSSSSSSSTAGAAVESHSSWLHELMNSLPTIPAGDSSAGSSTSSYTSADDSCCTALPSAAAAAVAGPPVSRSGSNVSSFSCQQSLPTLPEQRALPQQQSDVSKQQPTAARRNPFAAAAAAAAVHEAIGGCVAAVEPSLAAAAAADAAAGCSNYCDTISSRTSKDQDRKLSKSYSNRCSSNSSSSKASVRLGGSQSVVAAAFKSGKSSSSSSKGLAAVGEVLVQRAYLPHLQQLQLKHCSLAGVTLDDIITKPLVSKGCQHFLEGRGTAAKEIPMRKPEQAGAYAVHIHAPQSLAACFAVLSQSLDVAHGTCCQLRENPTFF